MIKKVYTAYGLNISSDFYLGPTADEAKKEYIDLNIVLNKKLKSVKKSTNLDNILHLEKGLYVFENPDIANFYIREGGTVEVNPYTKNEVLIRSYLTGVIMGMVLHQRGLCVLHASAILHERNAYLFVGPSGAGKSTMALQMMHYSDTFKIISDDLGPIFIDGKICSTYPGFPQLKLWSKSIKTFNKEDRRVSRIHKGKDKFIVESPEIPNKRYEIKGIFFINYGKTTTVRCIRGHQCFILMRKNIFTNYIDQELGLEANLMKDLSIISDFTDLFILERPKNIEDMSVCNKIMELI